VERDYVCSRNSFVTNQFVLNRGRSVLQCGLHTQAPDDFQFEDNTPYKEGEKKQLGCLEVGGVKHMVYSGKNLIGRDASCCSVPANSKTVTGY
jgi:hypothetical protein